MCNIACGHLWFLETLTHIADLRAVLVYVPSLLNIIIWSPPVVRDIDILKSVALHADLLSYIGLNGLNIGLPTYRNALWYYKIYKNKIT